MMDKQMSSMYFWLETQKSLRMKVVTRDTVVKSQNAMDIGQNPLFDFDFYCKARSQDIFLWEH